MNIDKNKDKNKYLSYCTPAGLLVGIVVAPAAQLKISTCIGIGMLIGIVIGTTIDYLVNNKEKNS